MLPRILLLCSLALVACSPRVVDIPDAPLPQVENRRPPPMVPIVVSETEAGEFFGPDDPRGDHPDDYGFTGLPPRDITLPGEYEPVERLLLGIPGEESLLGELVSIAQEASRESLVSVVAPENFADSLLTHLLDSDVEYAALTIWTNELDSIWMRDYGPLVVRGRDGTRYTVDLRYYPERAIDDFIPTAVADEIGASQVFRPAIELEGGNVQSDGAGRCITSERVLEANAHRGYDAEDVKRIFRDYLGCEVTIVPPLLEEQTGHVDMFLQVTGPAEVLVGRYAREDDEGNQGVLDEAARRLETAGFAVTRLPMPSNDGRISWRTYSNSVAINDVVLVPVYDQDLRFESEALALFDTAYPDRTIVPVVSDELITWYGALHCVTMTVAR